MATSKVRVHNDLWQVKTVSADSTEMNAPDAILLGKTDLTKLEILIREDMPYSVTANTVIHELCHAYCLSHGVTIRDEETAAEFFGAHGVEIVAASVMVLSELLPDEDIEEIVGAELYPWEEWDGDDDVKPELHVDDLTIGAEIDDDGK